MMQDIPETSYFKLIDYWLLFSLNMLALAMAFHTGLAFYIRRSRERKQEEEDDSREPVGERREKGENWLTIGTFIGFKEVTW